MKRAKDLSLSTAHVELRQELKEGRAVGRPKSEESRAKLQIFLPEDLLERAKIYAVQNKTTLTDMTRKLYEDFFENQKE